MDWTIEGKLAGFFAFRRAVPSERFWAVAVALMQFAWPCFELLTSGVRGCHCAFDCGPYSEFCGTAPETEKPIDQPLTPASKPSTDSPASQQPEQPAISAPYGIAIGGGTVNNPTVNNFAPPERHLDPSTLSDSKSCIAQNPGTVEIASIANSPEAYEYASEWLGYFKDAGWRIQDNLIHTFLIGGGVWTGTQIHIRGTYGATGREPKYDPTAPGGAFVSCLMGKKMPDATTVLLEETIATDHVIFEVGPGPAGSLP